MNEKLIVEGLISKRKQLMDLGDPRFMYPKLTMMTKKIQQAKEMTEELGRTRAWLEQGKRYGPRVVEMLESKKKNLERELRKLRKYI